MTKGSVVTLEESEKWDEIVRSFASFDVYYLSGYARAFQLHGDGEPLLYYYEKDNLRAMNVVMKRDLADDPHFSRTFQPGTHFDLATPYGFGGFILEGDVTEEKVQELELAYSRSCRRAGIISEFVRCHPVLKNQEQLAGLYNVTRFNDTVAMDLASKEVIWANLTHPNRTNIKKARNSGVEIFCGRSPELIGAFMNLYNATMNKDHAGDYYYFKQPVFDSILRDLAHHALFFYAVYEGKIIAMTIALFANGQLHLHLSASDKACLHFCPSNLLYYEVACWGADNGYRTLHMGGGVGGQADGLLHFKQSFNRHADTSFWIGRKIFDEERYEACLDIRKADPAFDAATGYFPAYRG